MSFCSDSFLHENGFRFFKVRDYLAVTIKQMFQHPEYPFMAANVDRFIDLSDETVGILECKTSNQTSIKI